MKRALRFVVGTVVDVLNLIIPLILLIVLFPIILLGEFVIFCKDYLLQDKKP